MQAATYTKLQDGSWGIRVLGVVKVGDRISVTKKSGERKIETVGRVVWTGRENTGDITLAAIKAAQQSQAPRSNVAPNGGVCDQCWSQKCTRAWNPRDLCDEN